MVDVQLNGQQITTSSATTTPAQGATETWTVTALGSAIPALTSGQTFSMVDAATPAGTTPEIVRVYTCTGPGATSVQVIRGADKSPVAAHANPATFRIVAVKSFLERQPDLPTYAPPGLLHGWDPRMSCYGFRQALLYPWRAALAKMAKGTRQLDVLGLGDSTMIGYNGAAYVTDEAIPRQMGMALARLVGDVVAINGYCWPCGDSSGGLTDQWTLAGGFAAAAPIVWATATGATATWKALDVSTGVEIQVHNQSTTGVTWTIDGVAQTPITTDGTNTNKMVRVTGLANQAHTVVVTNAAGHTTYVMAARPYNPASNVIAVHNLSLGGARCTSPGANANQNLADTTPTFGSQGLGAMQAAVMTAASIVPDLVMCAIGNNDVASATPAAILTGVATVRGLYNTSATTWLFAHPPMIPGSDQTNFDALSGGFFTQADISNFLYLDWNDLEGTTTGYTATGMAGADNVHPNGTDQRKIGRHIATLLAMEESGDAPNPTLATLAAPVATSGTTATKMLTLPVAAVASGALAGDHYELLLEGVSSSTGVLTFKIHAGAAGTTADNVVWTSTASAAQVANQRAGILTGLLRVASATAVAAEATAHAGTALLPTVVAAQANGAIVSTAQWFITISVTCSVGTFTAQTAEIRKVL